jgi:hypothetical protein
MGPDDQALKEELDLFAGARCWKAYGRSRIRAELQGRVLEGGSGIAARVEVKVRTTEGLPTAILAVWRRRI